MLCGDDTECYILCILLSVYDGMSLSNSKLKKPFSYDKWLLVDCNSHLCRRLPHLICFFSTTIHYSSSQIYLNMKSWLLRYLKYFDDICLSLADQFYVSQESNPVGCVPPACWPEGGSFMAHPLSSNLPHTTPPFHRTPLHSIPLHGTPLHSTTPIPCEQN